MNTQSEVQYREAKLSFRYIAGALVRKRIRFELETACVEHDLRINIIESKGWFESEYYVEIIGEAEIVRAINCALKEWFRELGAELKCEEKDGG